MSPGNYSAINSARCWSLYLLLMYTFNDYILLLMWPPFRNDCNPCLLSHTVTKHKQLVPISFTARSYLCHRHYRSCSALQPWAQSMSWSVSTSGRSACRAQRAVAQPQSQRRLERWYCQTHTPTSFLPQDTIHSYMNQKRRNLGDLVVPAGDHMNYSCLYIDISAQNEQTGDLCQVTHISSSLRPWVSSQALQTGSGSIPSWEIAVLRLLTVRGMPYLSDSGTAPQTDVTALQIPLLFLHGFCLSTNLYCLVLVLAHVYPQLAV